MSTYGGKMTEEKNKTFDWKKFKAFVGRDFVYIVVCLIAILACMYTLMTVGQYQQKCNAHWESQIAMCKCECVPGKYYEDFDLGLVKIDIDKLGGEVNKQDRHRLGGLNEKK